MNRPPVDDIVFVVIGRNEGDRLRQTLENLKSRGFKIVYVDSASDDGSADMAEAMRIHTVRLDSSLLTAARARNAGLDALRREYPGCKYVHFLDGDCLVEGDWVERAHEFLEARDDVASVGGRRFERSPDASFYNWLMDQEWNTAIGQAASCGGDSLMRLAALERSGAFVAELKSCEEPELCSRIRSLGYKIWRLDEAMTEHDANLQFFAQWWSRAVRAGYGYAQVWSATRGRPERLYGRELVRAFTWALGIPIVVAAAAIATASVAILLVYPGLLAARLARIALRRGAGDIRNWKYAALMTIVAFAETRGALTFFLDPRSDRNYDYKRTSSERLAD